MPKPIDPVALLSAVAVTLKKADTYPPEAYVIAIEELRQILFIRENPPLSVACTELPVEDPIFPSCFMRTVLCFC